MHGDVPRVKRFLERYAGDPAFRDRVRQGRRDLDLDPEELAPLWDPVRADEPTASPRVLGFRAFARAWVEDEARRRALARPSAPALAAWRDLQVERLLQQEGPGAAAVAHLPLAVELTKGCSVGCRFCGVSAGRLEGAAPADAEALEEWRRILQAVARVLGPAAAQGVLFWATDPLDHPAYEDFARVFAEVLGRRPSVTTALALRDPRRTRRLLQDRVPLRFSVLSLRHLERLHQEFTAEELRDAFLIPQFAGSLLALARAGRAREDGDPAALRTIACVSGFLLSLPDRAFRLITPVPADDDWPDGYRVVAQGRFADSRDLEDRLQEVVKDL